MEQPSTPKPKKENLPGCNFHASAIEYGVQPHRKRMTPHMQSLLIKCARSHSETGIVPLKPEELLTKKRIIRFCAGLNLGRISFLP